MTSFQLKIPVYTIIICLCSAKEFSNTSLHTSPVACDHGIHGHDWFWSDNDQIHFLPDRVLQNECDNKDTRNYWLLPTGIASQGLTIDRNCQDPFNTVYIKNTHNGYNNDRHAKLLQYTSWKFFC